MANDSWITLVDGEPVAARTDDLKLSRWEFLQHFGQDLINKPLGSIQVCTPGHVSKEPDHLPAGVSFSLRKPREIHPNRYDLRRPDEPVSLHEVGGVLVIYGTDHCRRLASSCLKSCHHPFL